MAERRRAAVNTVLPNRIYQRGQIFTWTREAKARCFEEIGLKAIVNFWPKIDPDLADMNLHWYWQLSVPRSEGMLDKHIMQAAEAVADYLLMPKTDNNVLILCEAGKTRSVFFCIQVVRLYKNITVKEATDLVKERVPSIALKGFMLDYMSRQK
jgi:hypothetical protein